MPYNSRVTPHNGHNETARRLAFHCRLSPPPIPISRRLSQATGELPASYLLTALRLTVINRPHCKSHNAASSFPLPERSAERIACRLRIESSFFRFYSPAERFPSGSLCSLFRFRPLPAGVPLFPTRLFSGT